MPKESIQHLFNLPGPWGWEKMQTYRNEKLSPSPLTAYSADRLRGHSQMTSVERGRGLPGPEREGVMDPHPDEVDRRKAIGRVHRLKVKE